MRCSRRREVSKGKGSNCAALVGGLTNVSPTSKPATPLKHVRLRVQEVLRGHGGNRDSSCKM